MNEKWEVIFYAKGEPQAYIIKGKLESEGIPVRLKQESLGRVYGLTTDGLGEVKILVPKRYSEKTVELLNTE